MSSRSYRPSCTQRWPRRPLTLSRLPVRSEASTNPVPEACIFRDEEFRPEYWIRSWQVERELRSVQSHFGFSDGPFSLWIVNGKIEIRVEDGKTEIRVEDGKTEIVNEQAEIELAAAHLRKLVAEIALATRPSKGVLGMLGIFDRSIQREDAKAKLAQKNPPAVAELLLSLLLPRKRCAALLGDLQEQFAENLRTRGAGRATTLYWAETIRSLGPLLLQALKKIGFFGIVAAALRKVVGG